MTGIYPIYLDTCVLQAIPNKSDTFHSKSDNVTLTILINPVNDLKPVLVNKVVLVVWQNSVTEITPSDLKYADNDTAPEDLMFKVLPPSGGHLALRDSTEVKILEFSTGHL